MDAVQESAGRVLALGSADLIGLGLAGLSALMIFAPLWAYVRSRPWGRPETTLISVGFLLAALSRAEQFGLRIKPGEAELTLTAQLERTAKELEAVTSALRLTEASFASASRKLDQTAAAIELSSYMAWATAYSAAGRIGSGGVPFGLTNPITGRPFGQWQNGSAAVAPETAEAAASTSGGNFGDPFSIVVPKSPESPIFTTPPTGAAPE